MTQRQRLGRQGEEIAAEFLRRQGYHVHETNVRSAIGELDIVASEGDVLVFVEVRTRSSVGFGTPAESVDKRKQQKLRQVAEAYLQVRYGADVRRAKDEGPRSGGKRQKIVPPPVRQSRPGEPPPCRIDVVTVSFGPDGSPAVVEHIRDAV